MRSLILTIIALLALTSVATGQRRSCHKCVARLSATISKMQGVAAKCKNEACKKRAIDIISKSRKKLVRIRKNGCRTRKAAKTSRRTTRWARKRCTQLKRKHRRYRAILTKRLRACKTSSCKRRSAQFIRRTDKKLRRINHVCKIKRRKVGSARTRRRIKVRLSKCHKVNLRLRKQSSRYARARAALRRCKNSRCKRSVKKTLRRIRRQIARHARVLKRCQHTTHRVYSRLVRCRRRARRWAQRSRACRTSACRRRSDRGRKRALRCASKHNNKLNAWKVFRKWDATVAQRLGCNAWSIYKKWEKNTRNVRRRSCNAWALYTAWSKRVSRCKTARSELRKHKRALRRCRHRVCHRIHSRQIGNLRRILNQCHKRGVRKFVRLDKCSRRFHRLARGIARCKNQHCRQRYIKRLITMRKCVARTKRSCNAWKLFVQWDRKRVHLRKHKKFCNGWRVWKRWRRKSKDNEDCLKKCRRQHRTESARIQCVQKRCNRKTTTTALTGTTTTRPSFCTEFVAVCRTHCARVQQGSRHRRCMHHCTRVLYKTCEVATTRSTTTTPTITTTPRTPPTTTTRDICRGICRKVNSEICTRKCSGVSRRSCSRRCKRVPSTVCSRKCDTIVQPRCKKLCDKTPRCTTTCKHVQVAKRDAKICQAEASRRYRGAGGKAVVKRIFHELACTYGAHSSRRCLNKTHRACSRACKKQNRQAARGKSQWCTGASFQTCVRQQAASTCLKAKTVKQCRKQCTTGGCRIHCAKRLLPRCRSRCTTTFRRHCRRHCRTRPGHTCRRVCSVQQEDRCERHCRRTTTTPSSTTSSSTTSSSTTSTTPRTSTPSTSTTATTSTSTTATTSTSTTATTVQTTAPRDATASFGSSAALAGGSNVGLVVGLVVGAAVGAGVAAVAIGFFASSSAATASAPLTQSLMSGANVSPLYTADISQGSNAMF